ncbi:MULTISPECIES: Arc family DNA-binding protein [unclassified Mesorhizobium]|uniref:Arc family DNA-binding protein n=1 Tax=unclassified Mesorhizobium TaxID=325217 RepID=UPI001092CD5C|nr:MULTISPECIES: Arc family DNA-binding protein [unclassified Mesorhizobium]TGP93812.1 Arc family DNA-binding protein [Mesorhizobium sp. M8A.F.Ca.ET.218.01.1.1]TGT18109.1 Arc family DNA-binding protein [Mesorhizobium sp. M8A.F.Ca.ET.213.01.1.1]
MPEQTITLHARIPAALMKRLKIAAAENGRSQNGELLARLATSFELDGPDRAQALALVNQLAALLEKP